MNCVHVPYMVQVQGHVTLQWRLSELHTQSVKKECFLCHRRLVCVHPPWPVLYTLKRNKTVHLIASYVAVEDN